MQAATQQHETTQSAVRLRGFIKNVQVTRGYCFVRADNREEYFLHVNEIEGGEKQMNKGALVEFTPVPMNLPGKSPRAVKAVVLSKPQPKQQ